jgi:YidC/Oxa1 family membrane protein insertase
MGLLLIGWSLFTKPSREKMKEAQRISDSIEQVQTVPAAPSQEISPVDSVKERIEMAQSGQIDSASLEQLKSQFGVFGDLVTGELKYICVETDLLKVILSNRGGRVYSVELKDYKTFDGRPLILFDGDSTVFGLKFFAMNRSINTNNLFFIPSTAETYVRVSDQPFTVTMRLPAGDGQAIEYVYTFTPGQYQVDFNIRFINMQGVIAANTNYIDLDWEQYIIGQEKGRVNEMNYTTMFFKHFEDEVDKFNMRSKKDYQEQDIPTRLKWIAFKQQFFSSVIIAGNSFNNAFVSTKKMGPADPYLSFFTAQIGLPYEAKERYDLPLSFYFGPNHYQILKKQGSELESLVSLGGFFSRVFNGYLIIPLFNFLNTFIRSYGLIIFLLTIIIKIILFPLTYRSYLSMAKMRVLKPEIDEINEKIPKEKSMERQQATMALYKKAGVSPLGGCLPMLLQMPILIAMFRFFPTSIELRQQRFLWAQDLSTYDSILNLPFNIPMYGDHVSLFTLLMTASTILTMKLSNQVTASQTQMPGMKSMMYIMPVMFMFILNNFSAALTYYYFLANVITYAQNLIFKQFVDEDALRKRIQLNKKKAPEK